MEERIRFVTYKNQKVLLVDLSNCTPDEVGQLCRLVPSYVTTEPRRFQRSQIRQGRGCQS